MAKEEEHVPKYVLVTGGVVSGLGKGITCSSLGLLLQQSYGLHVTALKIDPYLNYDAGTMSPYEHGECFVLHDGGEVDLDLGNYERFLGIRLTKDHNITSGKIFQQVLSKERAGGYLGQTVQLVPHCTDAIMQWIERMAKTPVYSIRTKTMQRPDICMIEMGGTVGDLENMIFIEALRRLRRKVSPLHFFHVHVVLIHNMGTISASTVPKDIDLPAASQKTKPAQASVQELRKHGLIPDMLICRSSRAVSECSLNKLSIATDISLPRILQAVDVKNIYQVPWNLSFQRAEIIIAEHLHISAPKTSSEKMSCPSWIREIHESINNTKNIKRPHLYIAIAGKYTKDQDSYLSLIHAIQHAALYKDCQVEIEWIETTDMKGLVQRLMPRPSHTIAGIIIPGGFGDRGIEGMIHIAQYARLHQIPFLGICLGMQVALIEIARNVLELHHANSTEFNNTTPHPIIDKHTFNERESKDIQTTMKLGSHSVALPQSSLLFRYYNNLKRGQITCDHHIIYITAEERFRHRYQLGEKYSTAFSLAGYQLFGAKGAALVLEAKESIHPFFVGVQFHPEYQTYPYDPAPAFLGFIDAALNYYVKKRCQKCVAEEVETDPTLSTYPPGCTSSEEDDYTEKNNDEKEDKSKEDDGSEAESTLAWRDLASDE